MGVKVSLCVSLDCSSRVCQASAIYQCPSLYFCCPCVLGLPFAHAHTTMHSLLTPSLTQGYTQFGGQRPFGVSLLYAGW